MPLLGPDVPLVSIIIPAFNARDTIVETVVSALAQSGASVEVIVVDDGSTDGTPGVLAAAGLLAKIRFESQANQGVSVARNRGLALARGRYICFLDSDDLLRPAFARAMVDALMRDGSRVGYCDYRYFADSPGRPTLPIRYPVYEGWVQGRTISEHFIPTTGAVLIAAAAIRDLRFDPALRNAQDWWFWTQLLMRERLCFRPDVLIDIRYRTASLSRTRPKRDRAVVNVLARTEPLLERYREALTDADIGRFYYRYASAFIDQHEFRSAWAKTRQCLAHPPGIARLANLACKFVLERLHLRAAAERLLWRRRLRRERVGARGARRRTLRPPRAELAIRRWPRPIQALVTVVMSLLQWL